MTGRIGINGYGRFPRAARARPDGRPIEAVLPATETGSSGCPSFSALIGREERCRTVVRDTVRPVEPCRG